ncbi:hypothetical protein AAF712_008548 [Marasmius tenuissimus]|uniref:Uncharacterized protein n=1 Tax=Marasmius tenuissimus TaxID=585030 RepID=A0ABR2ZS39_9AGAR
MPTAMLEKVKRKPAFAERFSEDEFKRVLEDARNKDSSDEPIGVNAEALKVFQVGQAEVTIIRRDIQIAMTLNTYQRWPSILIFSEWELAWHSCPVSTR